MLLLKLHAPRPKKFLWAMVAAYIFAIVGDYFLQIRTGDLGFILGIAGYFFTHVGFLIYARRHLTGRGRFSWKVLAVILIPFLIFYFVMLLPNLSTPMAIAVLVYLLISCMTLSESIDLRANVRSWKWVFAFGVANLLASDVLIALHTFAGISGAYRLYMWPLFYASMIFTALAVVMQHLQAHRARLDTDLVVVSEPDQWLVE